MTPLEHLEQTSRDEQILLFHSALPVNGLYYSKDNFTFITLNTHLDTDAKRCVTLAHELGHHYTHPPNLLIASKRTQDKYEHMATTWATNMLLPPFKLVEALKKGIRDVWDLAEYLGVTPEFIEQGLNLLQERYGQSVCINGCCLYFKPIEVHTI